MAIFSRTLNQADLLPLLRDRRSKEDDVFKISTSIFVTNFPDQTNAKELWRLCNQYGNVIDVFIPNKRSKVGKRFGFVRFIKISDVDRLVNNLCTIWIERFKIHANIARFNRPPINKGSQHPKFNANTKSASVEPLKRTGVPGISNPYTHAVKTGTYSRFEVKEPKPALVLDNSCLYESDFTLSLVGKLKEFGSLPNLKKLLMEEATKDKFMSHVGVNSWFSKLQPASTSFSIDKRIAWIDIEGVPVCAWTHNNFARISSIWGSLLHDEDEDASHFHRKRLCIKTTIEENIFDIVKIIVKGKVFFIRVKELTWWAPNFNDTLDDNTDTDDESVDSNFDDNHKEAFSEKASEINEIPKTVFEEREQGEIKSSDIKEDHKEVLEEVQSEDPFDIYPILNKKKPETFITQQSDDEPKYPPGFTPCDISKVNSNLDQNSVGAGDQEKESSVKGNGSKASYKEDANVLACSGHFKSVGTPKTGGSMLQVIEDLIKVGQTMGYKMEVMGKWIPNNKNLLIISIYAPQELAEKKILWQYLKIVIDRWKGDVIVMGDFNEVRTEDERFGSIFNAQGAAAFNSFISAGGLVEVPSGGGITIPESNAMLQLVQKLKLLKVHICLWVKGKKDNALNLKKELKNKLATIDSSIDKGKVTSAILEDRMDTLNNLTSLVKMESMELAQKAKIKWSIEGDENTKYYHGIINKRRNNLVIRGIIVDGEWIEDPNVVKNEFLSHFRDWFDNPGVSRLILDMDFPNKLSQDQMQDLERMFWSLNEDEVVDAVNHFFNNGFCPKGDNSSFIALIPKTQGDKMVKDFRPISLIGSLYKIIAKLFANRLVSVMGGLVNEVQSAFIANRQILDGPFILNEIIHWCKAKKKQTMIFKVDFEKAFDSVCWDFLDDVLRNFSFVMESLHLLFQNVINASLFKGVDLDNSLKLSHLFYADDVVFIGQWCDSNISTIIRVLDCFFRASSLRINLQKRKLMGIVVENSIVDIAANNIGCMTLDLLFSYLGVNIGGHMMRINYWVDVINKIHRRLSKWKMKSLSIGGRLTLLKSVLRLTPIYYMSMFKALVHVLNKLESIRSHFFNGVAPNVRKMMFVKWDHVLASKEKGGLGVSSFYALNRALIFKWVWRFRTQNTSFWSRVIKAIHGEDGKLGNPNKPTFSSNWIDIIRTLLLLYNKGIDLLGSIKKKLGNREKTNVSVATKMAHPSLGFSLRRKPRGGIKQVQMEGMLSYTDGLILPNMHDRWSWSHTGDGEFSVSSARNLIDDRSLGVIGSKTHWCKYVLSKVNIHSWRVNHNNLPTLLNLSRRGMDLDSILCPSCNLVVESTNHTFFSCPMMEDLYKKIARWWDVNSMALSSYKDWWVWFSNLRLPSYLKMVLEGVIYITWSRFFLGGACWKFSANVGIGSYLEMGLENYGILWRPNIWDASSKKFLVSCIIDKLPPYWKDFKHTLKHNKEELTLVELGSHLRIEESLRAQDSDKPKGNNVVGPQ
ncbi:RNA-directed DNA polymerase, eukaryota [Tanacetum coccineum]